MLFAVGLHDMQWANWIVNLPGSGPYILEEHACWKSHLAVYIYIYNFFLKKPVILLV